MDNHQADLADVLYFLDAVPNESAWVRALCDCRSGEPVLVYADVIVGPRPDDWQGDDHWSYPECAFAAHEMPSAELARTLTSVLSQQDRLDGDAEEDVHLDLGEIRPRVLLQPQRCLWHHDPSLARFDGHKYPWPSLRFDIPLALPQGLQLPQGFLIGDSAPSFPLIGAAFNAYFYGDFRIWGVQPPQPGTIVLRIADTTGRVQRVRIGVTSLDLWIEAESPDLKLEFNSANGRAVVPHPQLQTPASIPLPEGLPQDAWVWLKRGREWIDFRAVSEGLSYRSSDIEVEVPDDPAAGLSGLIAEGEGENLEFKSQLPDRRDAESKRKSYKTVTAFAVGSGGILIFGVEDRTGVVLGLTEDEETAKQRFTSMLRTLVRPTPTFTLRYLQLDGNGLLIADVAPSEGVLHALMVDADKPEYYVRRGATTFYARPEELTAIVESRQPQNPLPTSDVIPYL